MPALRRRSSGVKVSTSTIGAPAGDHDDPANAALLDDQAVSGACADLIAVGGGPFARHLLCSTAKANTCP
jgi:hypothetical protein